MTIALLWALAALTAEPPGDAVTLTRAEHTRLLQAAERAEALEKQVAALARRLELVEQRVGLAPLPRGGSLTPGAPGDTITWPRRATRLAEQGGRPRPGRMADDTQGARAAVITYWATWCKPCTTPEELRRLTALREQLQRHGIPLLSVAVDDLAKVRADPRAPTWLYPLWHGDDAHLDMLPERFVRSVGVGLPLHLVVDATGAIRYYRAEALDEAAVRDIVTSVASVCRL